MIIESICNMIITYQEKLGNYNITGNWLLMGTIITYQEKLGNYNKSEQC